MYIEMEKVTKLVKPKKIENFQLGIESCDHEKTV